MGTFDEHTWGISASAINETYTQRIQDPIKNAKADIRTTSEPAYRMLQILSHTKGTLTL